jgi:hypothetical protein
MNACGDIGATKSRSSVAAASRPIGVVPAGAVTVTTSPAALSTRDFLLAAACIVLLASCDRAFFVAAAFFPAAAADMGIPVPSMLVSAASAAVHALAACLLWHDELMKSFALATPADSYDSGACSSSHGSV